MRAAGVAKPANRYKFDLQMLRLLSALGLRTRDDLAEALGMHPDAILSAVRDQEFPLKFVQRLADQRPELGLNVAYIVDGYASLVATR